MADQPNTKPEPENFADLANQPSGSGVAAEQAAYMEAALDDAAADGAIETPRSDISAADADAMTPTQGGPAETESEAQPS